MTEKEDFLRVAKNIFDGIRIIDFSDKTKIEKLKELNRWIAHFGKQCANVEKMLDDRVNLGMLTESDKDEIIEDLIKLTNSYLK